VQGTLIAIGTSKDTKDIIFTSNETVPIAADWGNIRFDGSGSGGVIMYCSIEYSVYGIYIDNTSPDILYNEISNCNFAIQCQNSGSPRIDNNNIIGNYNGIVSNSYAQINTPSIRYNHISNNELDGIISMNNSFINVAGNTINKNLGSGISVDYGEAELYSNVITNNLGMGIEINDGNLNISDCVVSDNDGFGIGFTGPGNLTITNCVISNNSYSGIRVYGSVWFEIGGNKIYGNGINGVHHSNMPDAKPDGIYFYTGSSNVNGSIYHNDIFQNLPFNIYNDGISDINAENNWWGNSNRDSIILKIYDSNDDFALGTVDYEPWVDEPFSFIGREDIVISEFVLSQNYPNPFNPKTTISYQIPKSSYVKLTIYDINGRLIETLVAENKNAGYYTIGWNADKVCSGIYFYRIDAGEYTCVKKCLVVK